MSYDASAYPYDTVCYITDTIGGVAYRASGVLISNDCVLTAAHVVYSSTGGGVSASTITVAPGYSGGTSRSGTYSVSAFSYYSINDDYRKISGSASQQDFAVLHLSTPVVGVGYMGLQSNYGGGTATITGYPATSGTAQLSSVQQVTRDSQYSLLDFAGFSPGASGGPIWTGTASNPTVAGIVSSESANGGNFGGLITPEVFKQITAWVAAYDGQPILTPPNPATPITPFAVYRFFDTKFGTHFFTADGQERNTILATRPDLRPETNDFGTANPGSASVETVYRFFDNIHGTHFFTASQSEHDGLVKTRSDLVAEPAGSFLEHATQQAGDVAVYRFFDTKLGTHFYTGNQNEYAGLVGSGTDASGLKSEGVGFYAPSGTYL